MRVIRRCWSGWEQCVLHYEDNDAVHVENQLVLMDVGAMYRGYSADVTRTFPQTVISQTNKNNLQACVRCAGGGI